ncbi:MAG: hypothetical protein QM747_01505 [Nocardioides sp.]
MSTPYAGPPPDSAPPSAPYPAAHPALPPLPPRRRPGAWWFGLGAVLVVTAVILGAVTLGRFVHTLVHTDATFFDSGRHHLVLPPHERLGLYIPPDGMPRMTCRVLDGGGTPIPLERPSGHLVVNGLGLRAIFDTGDGQVTIACHGAGTIAEARIGTVPTRSDVLRLVFLGFVIPAVLGLAGLLILIVTTALRISSRRPVPPPPGPPGGIRPPPVTS